MIEVKNKARWAVEGFRIRRANADGTVPTAQRVVGFSGTVNLSNLFVNSGDTQELQYKINVQPWQTVSVGFATVANMAAVTPEEAAAALTYAADGASVSFAVVQGQLVASAGTGVQELQVKGVLAGALGFGQGTQYGGLGCYWKTYLEDETISAALPNDVIDREQIDMEGAKGTITRMIIPAKRLGASPALVMKFKDDELTQMIQGGNYIPAMTTAPAIYDPPLSDAGGSPLLVLEVFFPLYGEGASQKDQVIGIEGRTFYNCTGIEGDVPGEAKAWAQFAYNLIATEYTDENGTKWPAERRFEYSFSQWQALNIAGVGKGPAAITSSVASLSGSVSAPASLPSSETNLDGVQNEISQMNAGLSAEAELEAENKTKTGKK